MHDPAFCVGILHCFVTNYGTAVSVTHESAWCGLVPCLATACPPAFHSLMLNKSINYAPYSAAHHRIHSSLGVKLSKGECAKVHSLHLTYLVGGFVSFK